MFISLRVFVVSIKWMPVFGFKNNWRWKSEFAAGGPRKRERVISKRGASWLCVTALASSLTDGSSFPLISWLWNTETGKMLQLVWVLDLGVLPPPRGVWKSWEMVLFVTNEWNWSASCYVAGQGHLIVPASEEFILGDDLFCPKCQCLCWESLDSYWYEKK